MDDLKHMIDFGAIGSTVLALLDIVPHFTSLLALIWLAIRIYESETVQKLLGNTHATHTPL
jgi:hypothetical protein